MERLCLVKQEISENINNLLLTVRCDSGDCNKTIEKYADEKRILLPAKNQNEIDEDRFGLSYQGKLKFTDLYGCLGVILIDREQKIALAAHITPIDTNIEDVSNNYLKQIDDIYKIKASRVILVSSTLGKEPYHIVMEKLVKQKYGQENVELYKNFTVTYDIDSDNIEY